MRLFSTEQVSKYHPDKYADQISDAILTEYLKQDRHSRCGIETLVKGDTVVLGGEATGRARVDYGDIVKSVAGKLGYTVGKVINLIGEQSEEIGKAVEGDKDIGAGDQGMMFGYATAETKSFLPYGFDLANKIIKAVEDDVALNPDTILKGDAKTQVTVDLDKPKNSSSVYGALISVCHKENISIDRVREYVRALLAKEVFFKEDMPPLKINPAGPWTVGGAWADCGLTGRKIVCDQYGGYCPVGGGAFSGKDPTKVDRSASYMARKIAVDLLREYGLCECEVQLAYAIGVAKPVSVSVKCDKNINLAGIVMGKYDLTPRGIIDRLNLYSRNYEKIAEGCHYRPEIIF